jgi:hypothetical protein
MDPYAALEAAHYALTHGRRAEAREYLDGYWEWRGKHGYEPLIAANGTQYRGDSYARTIGANLKSMLNRLPKALQHEPKEVKA